MTLEQIQQLLKDAGYYAGKVDSDLGPLTREAVTKIIDRNKSRLVDQAEGWNDNRKLVAAGQLVLAAQGYYKGALDGLAGQLTVAAVKAWEAARKPPYDPAQPSQSGLFDAASAKRLAGAHPLLQRLLIEARKRIAFTIMDSQRGRAAQTKAYKAGHSKATFGNSAHNYDPAIAVDLAPIPLDWSKTQPFIDVWKVIGYYNPKTKAGSGLAKEMGIPIRWGGDWNMNGKWTDDGWDFPHYELYPWRNYATKLIGG